MECTTVKPIELTRGNNVEVDVEIDGKLLTFIIVGTNIIFCFRYTTPFIFNVYPPTGKRDKSVNRMILTYTHFIPTHQQKYIHIYLKHKALQLSVVLLKYI